jgi:uncharacterized NAD(P)/FAD-binding protein YdhS
MEQRARDADVAIVGAGLAGTTLAYQLVRGAPHARVLLFDRHPPGPGNAYATTVAAHRMNGPIRAMSAVPGDPGHLARWLGGGEPDELIPRVRYGAYLRALADEALAEGPAGFVRSGVVDVVPESPERYLLRDADGRRWRSAAVVLALGNAPPRTTLVPDEIRDDPRYVGDPWRFDGTGIAGDVLCIGTGLTALDVVATLADRGFTGTVHLVSRHGLVPLGEDPAIRRLDPDLLGLDASTPLTLLRTMRRAAREVVAGGGDWRAVTDAIRKRSPQIWAAWDLHERRRFLRHLHPYWSVHRYRIPLQTARAVRIVEERGRLVRHRGRLAAVRRDGALLHAEIVHAGEQTELAVGHIINCTGPESDYLRVEDPLVQNLLRRGLIRPDALRLGIDATQALRVIGAHGSPWPNLFTLGPPLRGLWYETTGVPEVRAQAAALASTLGRLPRYGSGSSEAGGARFAVPFSGTPDSTS